jgi:hypothetical protein
LLWYVTCGGIMVRWTHTLWRLLMYVLVAMTVVSIGHAERVTLFSTDSPWVRSPQFEDLDPLIQIAITERHAPVKKTWNDCVDGDNLININSVHQGRFTESTSQTAVSYRVSPCNGSRNEVYDHLLIIQDSDVVYEGSLSFIHSVTDVDRDSFDEIVAWYGAFGQGISESTYYLVTLKNQQYQTLANFGMVIENCGYYTFGTRQELRVEYEPAEDGKLPDFLVQVDEFPCDDMPAETFQRLRELGEAVETDPFVIHEVARSGDLLSIRYLADRHRHVFFDTLNEFNDAGMTPLMVAAAYSTPEVVRALLVTGADLHASDARGWTPLVYAARENENPSVLATILAAIEADQQRTAGRPLYDAVWEGMTDVVIALLDVGANPNVTTDLGWTPLHVAAERGDHDMIRALATAGANLDAADRVGISPLSIAVANGADPTTIELLIAFGANPNGARNETRTPLEWAIMNHPSLQSARELVRWGADPRERGRAVLTAAKTSALHGGTLELLDLLVGWAVMTERPSDLVGALVPTVLDAGSAPFWSPRPLPTTPIWQRGRTRVDANLSITVRDRSAVDSASARITTETTLGTLWFPMYDGRFAVIAVVDDLNVDGSGDRALIAEFRSATEASADGVTIFVLSVAAEGLPERFVWIESSAAGDAPAGSFDVDASGLGAWQRRIIAGRTPLGEGARLSVDAQLAALGIPVAVKATATLESVHTGIATWREEAETRLDASALRALLNGANGEITLSTRAITSESIALPHISSVEQTFDLRVAIEDRNVAIETTIRSSSTGGTWDAEWSIASPETKRAWLTTAIHRVADHLASRW